MSNSSAARRQPPVASLKLSEQRSARLKRADPTSPPDTPTTSPPQVRKPQPNGYSQLPRTSHDDPRIRPFGNGHQFSYQPFTGPEQLSPRSTSSSSSAESDSELSDQGEDEDEDETRDVKQNISPNRLPNTRQGNVLPNEYPASSDDADSEPDLDSESDSEQESQSRSNTKRRHMRMSSDDEQDNNETEDADIDTDEDGNSNDSTNHQRSSRRISRLTVSYDELVIEEVDPMDSEYDGLEVMHPTEIESLRSRSQSSQRQRELPIRIMRDLRNLNCSKESSDDDMEQSINDQEEADPEEAFYQWQQELRRRRVSMSSSIGKRTHSEISDSDCDDASAMDVNEAGSSARRMRKRVHRGSLLFQDPPEPRIDELDEPSSSEDEKKASQSLARELRYFQMEIMEMDSSS